MNRDESSSRTTSVAPTEIRSPPMSPSVSRRSSARPSSSPVPMRARSNSATLSSQRTQRNSFEQDEFDDEQEMELSVRGTAAQRRARGPSSASLAHSTDPVSSHSSSSNNNNSNSSSSDHTGRTRKRTRRRRSQGSHEAE